MFTTEVLGQPMSIEGQVMARLFIECDTVDTDLAVRLTDVFPDGRSILLVDGIQRVSLAADPSHRDTLAPGTIYDVTVSLYPTAATIPAGHRLGLLVAPSNYDRYDVNMQDGSDISDDAGAVPMSSNVKIHANATHPSSLTLPLVRFALTLQGASEITAGFGEPVLLEVTTEGRSAGLEYQWFVLDGQGGRTAVASATSSTLSFASAEESDSGVYVLTVTDGTQTVESAPITLTVDGPSEVPTISPLAAALLCLTVAGLGWRIRRREYFRAPASSPTRVS
jgi:hypothetical protein